jgi:CDP-diacylglycerol--glycerol-3-phosphate 3-phosphatidyltransferase
MSGLIGFYILSYLYIHLPENIPAGELELLPRLGPGTALSLLGGWLLAAMGGFLLLPRPQGVVAWLPALFFFAALMADLFDGLLARKSGYATRLGADLDMTLDGLGVLLASVLAVRWGQWPFWYILVGLARYLFVGGIAWRQRHDLPIFPTEDTVIRRVLAGLQRGFLVASLLPIMPAWLATAAGLGFVLPFLANFTYDWLVVSGVIDDRDPDFRAGLEKWRGLMQGWVALGLRVLTGLLAGVALGQAFSQREAFAHNLYQLAHLSPGVAMFLLGAGWMLAGLLLLGVAPRLTASLLYIPITFVLAAEMSFLPGLLALYGLTAVILLGPGPYALWQPEAKFFIKRLGS